MINAIREYGRIVRNSSQELRITRVNFNDRELIDFRIYVENSEGEWTPTRKGCTVWLEDIPQFLDIVENIKAEFAEHEDV